jgi:hypothetical protein
MITIMTEEDALYQALRLHGIGKLEQQDRKTLMRLAAALVAGEERLEDEMAADLGEDARQMMVELNDWVGVVYKAIDKLLSDGESVI